MSGRAQPATNRAPDVGAAAPVVGQNLSQPWKRRLARMREAWPKRSVRRMWRPNRRDECQGRLRIDPLMTIRLAQAAACSRLVISR